MALADSVSTIPAQEQHHTAVEGPKVLVVDDDANEQQLIAGLLEMNGCNVHTAENEKVAIELLKARRSTRNRFAGYADAWFVWKGNACPNSK